MGKQIWKCPECNEVTTYYKPEYLCAYCGKCPMVKIESLLNKNPESFNKPHPIKLKFNNDTEKADFLRQTCAMAVANLEYIDMSQEPARIKETLKMLRYALEDTSS